MGMSVGSTRSASLPTSSPKARAAACCSSSSSLESPAMSCLVSSGRMMRSALVRVRVRARARVGDRVRVRNMVRVRARGHPTEITT